MPEIVQVYGCVLSCTYAYSGRTAGENTMGRPLNPKFLGANAVHQIQATIFGKNDSQATPGYLSGQNSATRFKATTPNGTSITSLVNGPANVSAAGTSCVQVFPTVDGIVNATITGTRKVVGTPTIAAAGTGYVANSYLILNGGTATGNAFANIKITAVDGNGNVTAISTADGTEAYLTLPSNIANISTTNVGGTGAGAVLSANFGLKALTISNGGANYPGSSANVYVDGATTAPTITAPTVTAGVVATGAVTITAPGIVNTPNLMVSVEAAGSSVEYLKSISQNHLLTFQGHTYKWLPNGQPFPPNYSNVPVAYLDTK